MATVERFVLRRPQVQQGMRPQHRGTDGGLVLAMEDWFSRGVFGKHPHRGIEAVGVRLRCRCVAASTLGLDDLRMSARIEGEYNC